MLTLNSLHLVPPLWNSVGISEKNLSIVHGMIGSAWFNGKSLGIAQIWVPNKDLSKDSCVTPTPGVTVRFKSRGPNVYMPQNVSSFPSPASTLYLPCCSTLSSSLLCCQIGGKFKITCNSNSGKREEIKRIGRRSREWILSLLLHSSDTVGLEPSVDQKLKNWPILWRMNSAWHEHFCFSTSVIAISPAFAEWRINFIVHWISRSGDIILHDEEGLLTSFWMLHF